jgi:hypothetical protein
MFRAHDIGLGRVGHIIHHTARQRDRQPALCLDGLRIERQRALVETNRLGVALTRWRLRTCCASPEDVVQRIGMHGCAGGLRADQLRVKRDRDPPRNLVLQSEQIGRVAVEPLGP